MAPGQTTGQTTGDEKGNDTGSRTMAFGSVLGALAASSCCILPLVLFSLGAGGAWIGNLTALAPYQPFFVAVTVCFLGAGFYMVYRKPKLDACEAGTVCARPGADRINKIALWSSSVLVALAVAFNFWAPILLDY
ncbi:MAG: mercury transporter MerT [Alphaproteobacteria bacterium]|nr:mercury transporter MerT [Alphaproteobacteria bacterium]MBT7943781.1 mercury transporter MerT [Alphaproteobacteria bacterium]